VVEEESGIKIKESRGGNVEMKDWKDVRKALLAKTPDVISEGCGVKT